MAPAGMQMNTWGMHHAARTWAQPEIVRPEHFRIWNGSAYSRIPQGGVSYEPGHRCASEWITSVLIKTALRLLIWNTDYRVPQQDLRIKLSRMPAIPESRCIISKVRRRRQLAAAG